MKPFGQVGQKTALIVDTIHQCTNLLHISVGIGTLTNADTISAFGRRPAGGIEWRRDFAFVTPNQVFEGKSVRLLFRRRSNRKRVVWICAIGSESNALTSSM